MPTILGTAAVGQTLTCNPNATAWGGVPTFTYAWLRDGAPIAGAAGATYLVSAADGGHASRAGDGDQPHVLSERAIEPRHHSGPRSRPADRATDDATPGRRGQRVTLDAA